MATGAQVWSVVPINNATIDTNVNFAEGMAPSQVNDSSRAAMASVAKYIADNSGVLVTSGSSTALTVATNQVESALTTGFTVTATLGTAMAAAATLAVDGLAATNIYTALSTASQVTTGQFAAQSICSFIYSTAVGTGGWIIANNSPLAFNASVLSPLLTTVTNTLSSPVSLNSTASFFTGPTVSQGSSGTWFASGTVSLIMGGSLGGTIYGKLWDGTTVIDSGQITLSAGFAGTMSLSGLLASPASNLAISVLPTQVATMNSSTLSSPNASVLTAIRVA